MLQAGSKLRGGIPVFFVCIASSLAKYLLFSISYPNELPAIVGEPHPQLAGTQALDYAKGVVNSVGQVNPPDQVEVSETKQSNLLIITPTYNEIDNLEAFARSVFAILPDAHVLVVDDASPDGTGQLADRLAADDPRMFVIHRAGKEGLGTAYVTGFRWALAHGYQFVFEMDADLSHNPWYLPSFLQAFANGADVVVGSRNIPGGGVAGWGLGRHFLSKGGSLYSRWILGVPIHDLTTGFKGYTRQALEAIEVSTLLSNGYSFQIETTYRALKRNLNVVEVPIVFADRRVGQSKMSRRIFIEAIGVVWKLRLYTR
jgi:dolichol-phosphate mannosyltransferase